MNEQEKEPNATPAAAEPPATPYPTANCKINVYPQSTTEAQEAYQAAAGAVDPGKRSSD